MFKRWQVIYNENASHLVCICCKLGAYYLFNDSKLVNEKKIRMFENSPYSNFKRQLNQTDKSLRCRDIAHQQIVSSLTFTRVIVIIRPSFSEWIQFVAKKH